MPSHGLFSEHRFASSGLCATKHSAGELAFPSPHTGFRGSLGRIVERSNRYGCPPMSGKQAVSHEKPELISLRELRKRDLTAAHGLSVAVAWPHRLSDWEAAFAVGRGYGAHDPIGRLVATALWWPIGPSFAMVGLVIVDPGFQGRGLGRRLMDAIAGDAGARTLQLNSTTVGVKLYEAQGFRTIGALKQYQGIARVPKRKSITSADLRPATEQDWGEILSLDRAAVGHDRSAILRGVIGDAPGIVSQIDGRITGFAFCRPFGRGRVIGPVIAAEDAAAIAIANSFATKHRGEFLRIDIPDGTPDLIRAMEARGLLCAGGAITMTNGASPAPSGEMKIFGLISQAIG
jgi:GNAT superfamily N-acetyltransferase